MTKNNIKTKRENPWLNLILNILLPAILMMKGQKWFDWSPQLALAIALTFPISYGFYDFYARRKCNAFSIIGFISILLTGGVGLLELSKDWIAVKEGAIPLALGFIVLGSLKTRYPLIRTFLYNDQIIQVDAVDRSLEARDQKQDFEQLLKSCTYLLSSSFFLSAILNYFLAKIIVQSETGTAAFTEEIGQMTLWSYPVIVLPCTVVMGFALWKLLKGLKTLTDLELEDIFINPEAKKN